MAIPDPRSPVYGNLVAELRMAHELMARVSPPLKVMAKAKYTHSRDTEQDRNIIVSDFSIHMHEAHTDILLEEIARRVRDDPALAERVAFAALGHFEKGK